MPVLSVLIITKNEATTLADCLRSVAWADELIVLDSGSTDDTCAIAEQLGARVFHHAWQGYAAQKNYGATLATGEWILSVDADERATPELRDEIQHTLQKSDQASHAAYRIPIRDWMFGKFIAHGSWPGQKHVRLYRASKARWGGAVHEGVGVDGSTGDLHQPLLHFSHLTVGHFISKLNTYTEIEAKDLFAHGQRVSLLKAFMGAVRAFMGQYVRLKGYRDGGHGFILAVCMAFYFFTTQAKLWSMHYLQEHPRPT